MAQKYYHASPKRFKIGTVLTNCLDLKRNFECSEQYLYITTSPHPHHTIWKHFKKLNIYEVLPIGKIQRGMWDDLIVPSIKIIKYIGVASDNDTEGLGRKDSAVLKNKKTISPNNRPHKKFKAIIYVKSDNASYLLPYNYKVDYITVKSNNLNKIKAYIKIKTQYAIQ